MRMPVLGGHGEREGEALQQRPERAEDRVAIRHAKRAAGQEVGLDVDDDERSPSGIAVGGKVGGVGHLTKLDDIPRQGPAPLPRLWSESCVIGPGHRNGQ